MRSFIRLLIFFIGFLFFAFSVPEAEAQRYNFRNYSLKDGLVQSQASKILEDEFGRIWIGTLAGGVSVFDGNSFKRISVEEGLLSNEVNDMIIDCAGKIWMATVDGISVYDGKKIKNYSLENGLPNNNVSIFSQTMVEDLEHHLWFGTDAKGVVRFSGKEFVTYDASNGYTDELTTATALDGNGTVWLGAGSFGKLIAFRDGRFEVMDSANTFINEIQVLAPDHILLGTDAGIYVYDGKEVKAAEGALAELKNAFIYDIQPDFLNHIWIGTKKGAYCLKNQELVHYTKQNGLSNSPIYDIECDRDNSIWLASDGEGIFKFEGERFTYLTEKEGLENHIVMNMAEDDEGNVWISSLGKGVSVFDGQTFRSVEEHKIISDQQAHVLYKARDKSLWVGTKNGLAKVKDGKIETLNLGKSYENAVYNITEDSEGNLWFGGYGRLVKYNGVDKEVIYLPDSLADTNSAIEALKFMKDGRLLVAIDRKVLVYDGNAFNRFASGEKIHQYSTNEICFDKKGNLWFSLLGEGVARFDGSQFEYFGKKEGLSSEQVFIMHIDRYDNVWVGTEKGVDRLRFIEGKPEVKKFGYEEGFIGIETNQNAVLERDNGEIWFGTIGGIMIYEPLADVPNSTQPITYISEVKLFYETVDWSKFSDTISPWFNLPADLELPYDHNHLTFIFNGVSLKNPEQVTYQYQLEPLEEHWSPVLKQNEAVYSNIPPGEYTFKVKAANNEGLWNKDPVTYSFTVRAPFWQETWFWLLVIVFLIGSTILYFKFKTRQLKIAKVYLEQKVKERTAELRQQKDTLEVTSNELKITLKELDSQNLKMTQSINYAKRIQDSILPKKHLILEGFSDHFLFFKPRDIVSGDFYWYTELGNKAYLAVVDCTGHGVPGAFMSMIGYSLLNQIVKEQNISRPSDILTHLKKGVLESLNYERDGFNRPDSMDVALIAYDRIKNELIFSGAKRPLYIVKDGELQEIKGDRMTVGYEKFDSGKKFTEYTVPVEEGTMIYLTSDGYADQFGGEKNSKFMVSRLKKLLMSIEALPVEKQYAVLEEKLNEWKGDYDQTDDIMVVGVRLNGEAALEYENNAVNQQANAELTPS